MTLEEREAIAREAHALYKILRSEVSRGVTRFTPPEAIQLVAGAMPSIIEDVRQPRVTRTDRPWRGF